jgi:arylsulfatase A-like enzyme
MRIIRLHSLNVACLLVFFLHGGWVSADSAKRFSDSRPNIIVILADDLGFSDLGCYGSEIKTPALDRMADEGLRFTQFYNAARCCPTRAALLTGLYPHQAGIGYMGGNVGIPAYQGFLNDRCVTIGEALREGGYRTLMSGKWHVGGDPAHWPRQRGFDRYFGLIDGASSYWELGDGRRMALDNTPYTPEGDDFYMTDAFTDYAVEFIEESRSSDAPFFLYLAYTAPHFPLHARPAEIAKYRGVYALGWDALRESRHARMKELGIVEQAWPLSPLHEPVPGQRIEVEGPWSQIQNRAEWEALMEVYAAMIDRMDQGIGRVRAKLEELDMADNTLIMFMSDNGACAFRNNDTPAIPPGPKGSYHGTGVHWAQASDTPFRRYKQWTHEGGIASPLVAWWPDGITRPGRLNHEPGHVIDIMATCLDVAGVPYPAEYQGKPITALEGKTLAPVFSRRQRVSHEAIFWEHMGSKAVRQGKWKLVAQREIQEWELYDMETDRTELHDLADRHPEKVSEMAALYDAWAEKAGVRPWQDILKMQRAQ